LFLVVEIGATMTLPRFEELFECLTGHAPRAYQVELARRMSEGELPEALDVPTGMGKTLAVVVAWGATWFLRRRHPDHLEMALPEGLIVVGLTWVIWTALHYLTAALDDVASVVSWAVMTGTFLLVFLGGWRWLYGYVRAHDSLTPKALERRLAQQEQDTGRTPE